MDAHETTPPSDTVVRSCRLYYKDGKSDKEYHAAIDSVTGGYLVIFAFGRRGSALQPGTKTTAPVPLSKAEAIYDKLVAEKTAKGYTPDGSGALFAMTENANRQSGLRPQLLNSIAEETVAKYLADDVWCAQEKFDGKRIMIARTADGVEGSNRKGLYVSLPQEISDALRRLPECELDGELIGGAYVVFDLLKRGDACLRETPYRERYDALVRHALPSPLLKVAAATWDAEGKQALYDTVKQAGGEGLVFKRADGRSIPGRPASGGSQVKFKFTKTCTCQVAAVNDQRSVRLRLRDPDAGVWVDVGNVTIPPNKAIPAAGALVEIRYLYAYRGGSLYQPFYLGERDDLDLEACTLAQLVHKPEASDEGDEEG